MPAPVVLIGMDAAEPTRLAAGSMDERFPTLARITSEGAFGTLVGLHRTFPGSMWPEIRTGMSSLSTGNYLQHSQVCGGEALVRSLTPGELSRERFYWNMAAAAGQRVAVVDMPWAVEYPPAGAHEIAGWGTHYRRWPSYATSGIARDLVDASGAHPVWDCYLHSGTDRAELVAGLHVGIDAKAELLARLLAAEDWDLFTGVFSESHCAGHHVWPTSDGDRRLHEIYRHLDAAIGSILDTVGADATVIVYTSHGITRSNDGWLLVSDVLTRMGLLSANRFRRRVAGALPGSVRRLIRRVVGGPGLQRVGATLDRPLHAGRAVAVPSGDHGLIRLSLRGRDPGGQIEPASGEHRDVLARIRTEFLGLRLDDGSPAVDEVVIVDDEYGADRHPDLPDIVIRFRGDVGPITACHSDTLGTIRAVRAHSETGQHGTPGALWSRGPGITPGTQLGEVNTLDFAPTVLALLGLELPTWMDGAPIPDVV